MPPSQDEALLKAMELKMAKETPAWQRILRHLQKSSYDPGRDFVAPPTVTQDGMADKLHIPRAYVATVLRDLRDEGLVNEKPTTYIEGARRRMKAYSITPQGYVVAQSLKANTNTFMTVLATGAAIVGLIAASSTVWSILEVTEDIETLLERREEVWY